MNQFFAQLETFASPVFNHSSLTASMPSHEGLYVIHHLWWKTDVPPTAQIKPIKPEMANLLSKV